MNDIISVKTECGTQDAPKLHELQFPVIKEERENILVTKPENNNFCVKRENCNEGSTNPCRIDFSAIKEEKAQLLGEKPEICGTRVKRENCSDCAANPRGITFSPIEEKDISLVVAKDNTNDTYEENASQSGLVLEACNIAFPIIKEDVQKGTLLTSHKTETVIEVATKPCGIGFPLIKEEVNIGNATTSALRAVRRKRLRLGTAREVVQQDPRDTCTGEDHTSCDTQAASVNGSNIYTSKLTLAKYITALSNGVLSTCDAGSYDSVQNCTSDHSRSSVSPTGSISPPAESSSGERCEPAISSLLNDTQELTTTQLQPCRNRDIFTCALCPAKFNRKINLVGHVRSHGFPAPNRKNQRSKNTPGHRRKKMKSYSCAICGDKFTNHPSLKKHITAHADEKPFSCAVCKTKFADNSTLRYHLLISHPGVKHFPCNVCLSLFTKKCDLRKHMLAAHKEMCCSCGNCKAQFHEEIHMISHARGNHNEELPAHGSSEIREAPNNSAGKPTGKPAGTNYFSCDICPAIFEIKNDLIRHIATHTVNEPFSCTRCEAKFAYFNTLVAHIRTHTDKKTYACKVCKARFHDYSTLRNHMPTHTGEKPFSCEICSAKFAHVSSLRNHRYTHFNKKPFQCALCGSMFCHKSDLSRHMSKHTGVKPYKCTVCEAAFTQSFYLKKHIAEKHAQK